MSLLIVWHAIPDGRIPDGRISSTHVLAEGQEKEKEREMAHEKPQNGALPDNTRLIPVPDQRWREIDKKYEEERNARINLARSSVVRKQVVEAYEILDRIRLTEGLTDTDFREELVAAKRHLEGMLQDFLLDDAYWRHRVKDARNAFGSDDHAYYHARENWQFQTNIVLSQEPTISA